MRRRLTLALIVITLSWITAINIVSADNWPQWRGPLLNGLSNEKNLPVKWSPEENVTWKLQMPAWTGSTPIVWNNQIFLNIAEGGNLNLWSIDRNKGTVLWKKLLGGGDVKLRKQNMSSPSPVTDGRSVWALTGTGILKGFDFKGNEIWTLDIQKEYGKFGLNWGYASSPLLYQDSLFVPVLHGMRTDEPSYILRINKMSGKVIWRVERPTPAIQESPDAYTTPALFSHNGTTELIISGGDCVTGHDLASGKELWRSYGLNPTNNPAGRTVNSPLAVDGMIYAGSRARPYLAIRPGGRGDVTQSHRAWTFEISPDVPTPVTDGKYFYIVRDNGGFLCLDAKTGKEIYPPQRLKPGTYSGSPVLADGKIYVMNEEGMVSVVKAGQQFEILAENAMNESQCLSTPAISDGQIFIRTAQYLYCIGKRASK